MKITYYYNACVGIETPDMSILCDPWFTDPIYDGSWYHFPPFEKAIDKIPKYDYIWISHIHPDHYDPPFLKAYLKKYPKTKILISNFKDNILHESMKYYKLPHLVMDEMDVGSTSLGFFPNETSPDDVDSALAIKSGDQSVVNMNDNLYNPEQIARIKEFCPSPTVALLGYIGAGPYPQTYFDDKKILMAKAEDKKERMFERYRNVRDGLNPKRSIPFAGQYVLGGKLWNLNKYRGVADATEVLTFDKKAVVLEAMGSLDTKTLKAQGKRTKPYKGLEKYAESLKNNLMKYEQNIPDKKNLKFEELLPKAYKKARLHSHCDTDFYYCIKVGQKWFYMNANKKKNESGFKDSVENFSPRSEITIDQNYLYGLLTHTYHWSDAQIGSQYSVRRFPDIFNRSAENFFNFLQI